MLATALDCHPDIHFLGEYNGVEPTYYGRGFCIVHMGMLNTFTSRVRGNPKRVYLFRNDYDRRRSNDIRNACSSPLHYEEPATLTVPSRFARPGNIPYQASKALIEEAQWKGGLVLHYEDLTHDSDIDQIEPVYQNLLEDFLGLERGHPFKPKYRKPTVRVT